MSGRRAGTGGSAGFTLVEILVAVVVLMLMLAAVGMSIDGGLNLSRNNKNRTVAANLAAEEMDKVRGIAVAGFSTLASGQVETVRSVAGVPYTIQRDSYWVAKDATASPCDGPGGSALAYMRVTVTVRWPKMDGARPVQSTTVITPPVSGYSPVSGHLPVKVTGADGSPRGGVRVRLLSNGSEVSAQETTNDGCAFFGYLSATSGGTPYTVVLDEAGYVDGQSNPMPAFTTTVYPGAYTPQSALYDVGGSLALTLGSAPLGAVLPNSVPVVIGNQHFALGRKVFPGDGGVRAINSLFPWPDGYETWVGECADADPEGTQPGGGPFYPGQGRGEVLSFAPGSTASGGLTLAGVQVVVRGPTGAPLASASITIRLVHGTDELCAAGESLDYPVVTDAVGGARLAVPFGRWQLTVVGANPASAWPLTTIAPPAADVRAPIVLELQ